MATSSKGSSGARAATSGRAGAAKTASTTKNKSASGSDRSTKQQPGSMLEKWFHDQLKDLYYAEKALTKALPKMRKHATSSKLQSALEEHLRITENQVKRLEQAFEALGKRPAAKKCDAMDGLIKEGEHAMEETKDDTYTRDVAIIMAAQKVEHYEICAYATLAEVARTMKQARIAQLMETTLQEEKDADRTLTIIAEHDINLRAEQEKRQG